MGEVAVVGTEVVDAADTDEKCPSVAAEMVGTVVVAVWNSGAVLSTGWVTVTVVVIRADDSESWVLSSVLTSTPFVSETK